ncbi:MAG: MFS transporter [Planctomycetaceae bacterium]
MTDQTPHVSPAANAPKLSRDPSFWGITITQFLGAFNDNLFKQLVLLLCIDYKQFSKIDLQPKAIVFFTLPFVFFSGFSGYLADRLSKQRIIVFCKFIEIGIAGLAMWVLLTKSGDPGERLSWSMLVLFLMGTHSSLFGPAKYGILPDLFRTSNLPNVNGIIMMTTFLAIILGTALAGFSKDWFRDQLWVVSAMGMVIAVVGTWTSLLIRRTTAVQPQLKWEWSSLAIPHETWQFLKRDRALVIVLLVASLFWFVGGATQQIFNSYGKQQLQIGDSRTSLLGVFIALGIMIGCLLAGRLSRHRINFRLVTSGTWGMILSLLGLMMLGLFSPNMVTVPPVRPPVPLAELISCESWIEFFSRIGFLILGLSAGLFIVPLQVFIQTRPPENQKGRMIGAMNLINWIFILFSAAFYFAGAEVATRWGFAISYLFGSLAVILIPLALWYRPKGESPSTGNPATGT